MTNALYDPRFEHEACGIGLVANLDGRSSHAIVRDAGVVLQSMRHRGATGADSRSGDGAGILTELPTALLRESAARALGVALPHDGRWAAGHVFLPRDRRARAIARRAIEDACATHHLAVLGWQPVPTDPVAAHLGPTSLASMPTIERVYVAPDRAAQAAAERRGATPPASGASAPRSGEGGARGDATEGGISEAREGAAQAAAERRGATPPAFEQALFLARKLAARLAPDAYVCSLSSRSLVLKGMLTPEQLFAFYPELVDPAYASRFAIVHSRFSTNTLPSWSRAQPLRMISHNGEINTLRGNVSAQRAREALLASPARALGASLADALPAIERDVSDSGTLDNVLELLVMGGLPLDEAVRTMIPPAWERDATLSPDARAFFEHAAARLEPWDGPAALVFTDGSRVGAALDKNGLRPARWLETRDGVFVLASEAGALPIAPSRVRRRGRLGPGRMLLLELDAGRDDAIVDDDAIVERLATARPYRRWVESHRNRLADLPRAIAPSPVAPDVLHARMLASGYTTETQKHFLFPLVTDGRDPVGSMGDDAALALLAAKPRHVADHMKQLFAQVTNPPIDPIRESLVMSLETHVGPVGNALAPAPEDAGRLLVPHPLVTSTELASVREHLATSVLETTFARSHGPAALDPALHALALAAEACVDEGAEFLVLSDRAVDAERVAIPSLLAAGAVHQHLVRAGKRALVGLVVEAADAREVHHMATLLGFGADAVCPWLAYEALARACREGLLPAERDPVEAYRASVGKGLLKVMAKMGISTLRSYRSAQIFEAVGLASDVVDRCFGGTASRVSGLGLSDLAERALELHARGFARANERRLPILPNDGQLQYREGGERHAWDPTAIATLQQAARGDDRYKYRAFSEHVSASDRTRGTLRALLRFATRVPIPLDEVEPASEIVKRFVTGAMSYGSISEEAHTTLALAMNRIGGKSNSGEGGEDEARYAPLPDGSPNPRRSRIKQVASGRFGVTIGYLASADDIQIKMAQGAKPGEGGELPGKKVGPEIARVRCSTPGVGLISPPPHHDIYSIEDFAQLVHDLRSASPDARVGVKLVAEAGIGTVAAGVAKANVAHILVSGHDGGTGASALTSIKHAGLPWELGLAETHQTLVRNGLRERVVLQVDGQLKTGRDVVIAVLLGAEEVGFATAPLVTLGCVMMRKCHLDTCPVGIATQDPVLRARFAGKPEHVVNYLFMVAEEAREIMASLGFRTVREMVGRVDALEPDDRVPELRDRHVDLSAILSPAVVADEIAGISRAYTATPLVATLDAAILGHAHPAIERDEPVHIALAITNADRSVGARLSHDVTRARGARPLGDDAIHATFTGSAGQSFGAFLARGITLDLEGEANDYVGKGLSGGVIVIRPPRDARFASARDVIIGNVALYGATSGRVFIRGEAAERFGVRNSGATSVVEGVGDHGCEYMTGGRVVVLGPTGKNFAAGMSGGLAYVWDVDGRFGTRVDTRTVSLERPSDRDLDELRELVAEHALRTASPTAVRFLDAFELASRRVVKVVPMDYRRALETPDAEGRAA